MGPLRMTRPKGKRRSVQSPQSHPGRRRASAATQGSLLSVVGLLNFLIVCAIQAAPNFAALDCIPRAVFGLSHRMRVSSEIKS